MNNVINHYDSLIDENNDPVYDPKPLQEYMDKWDGQAFIDELQLAIDKDVLEIGVGTGRLALKVCGKCKSFVGADVSPKTTERAKENLFAFRNKELVCGDFLIYSFDKQFDIIYSSLTFMHIKDKQGAINKVAGLLRPNGRFVLSTDKSKAEYIDMGSRKVKIYPDSPDDIRGYCKTAKLVIEKQFETDFATIFVMVKGS